MDLRVPLAGPVAATLHTSLAFLWIYTATVSILLPQQSGVMDLLARCASPVAQAGWRWRSCALDVALGLAALLRPSVRLCAAQAAA